MDFHLHLKLVEQIVSSGFFDAVLTSILASAIFYYFIVYYPKKKAAEISKNIIISSYKDVKIRIIDSLLGELGRDLILDDAEGNVFNYTYIKDNHVSSNDIKDLSKDLENSYLIAMAIKDYECLRELRTVLLMEFSQEYISSSEPVKKNIVSLIHYIDEYPGKIRSNQDRYHKIWSKDMHDLVLGISSSVSAENTPKFDEFPKMIGDAYSGRLLSVRLCKIISNLCEAIKK